ncbi:MAG: enoyl-CoA hydratase/isomerase family protein [Candidatus Krumholzibacteria bacterium]|nr:enoyl-CoA hydratase/isomerase family protein [Candidatus Krumholzibacteria bacterium]
MVYERIAVNELHDGQVVEIVFGPPPGNIVSADLIEEMSAELRRLDNNAPENKSRKLIILTGEGKHFSYGASVEEHRAENVAAMLPAFHSLIGQVVRCTIPTMAKVSGLCLGGGFELALACSLIFTAEDAKFGVPEIKLGVFPPAASVLLPCKAGDSAVCHLILTGATFTAADLHRLGIVNTVAQSTSLNDVTAEFVAKEILPKSASSLRIACEAARMAVVEYFDAHIETVEKLYLDRLMSTSDAVEGIEAFLDKRHPKWIDG